MLYKRRAPPCILNPSRAAADTCDATLGVTHTVLKIDDANVCTTDTCNASTGTVSHTPASADDGNPCTTDTCDPVSGQSHTPREGYSACGQSCVDLKSDAANCGACGRACANGEMCSNGDCACAAGSQICGTSSTACIDLASDGDNCGACGNACPAGQTCVAGTCGADVSAFGMLGGDPGHSGLNPGETGVPPLTRAWVAASAGGGSPPVIEGGRVFALNGRKVHALEAANGAEIWSYDFGSIFQVGWPAVKNGKVYVPSSNHSSDTWLRQFDRGTGELGFKLPFGSQWETYWSPIVVGDKVYLNGGYYGGLYGFDATTATQLFFNSSMEQYDEWSPAFFGGKVYSFVAGNVRVHDPATGATQATLNVGWSWAGWSMQTVPVFGDTYGYVIAPPNLFAFDPTTMKQVWTVNSSFKSYPAVAAGTVYALGSNALQAIDATTGSRKWLFEGDGRLAYPPVIAAGYVYVSSDSNVYAVDPATHKAVWTAPIGGRLAIGSGMLFVSSSSGNLTAFRLTR